MNPELSQLLLKQYRGRRKAALIMGGIALALMIAAVLWGVGSAVIGPSSAVCPPRSRFHGACMDHFYRDVLLRTVILGGLMGLMLLIASLVFWPLRDLAQAPLMRVFTAQRSEVVWIYPKRTSVRRYGSEVRAVHAVVVGLRDRKRIELEMSEDEVKTAMRLMGHEAPRAARGFSSEHEGRFLRDPTAMLGSAATLVSPVVPDV
jgi:hypothetical protein